MIKKKQIYLDYNATSALKPEVKRAMLDVMDLPLNPSSVHQNGREAKRLINEARAKIKSLVNAGNGQVIFTCSGTEANNLAINGNDADSYFVTATEHLSVLKPAARLRAQIIPVNEQGIVNLSSLEKLLASVPGKKLVSIMLANNETGVIQPIKELANIVFKHNGYFHCDASQAVGKVAVDMQDLNVDMLTISAHKFGGPQGAASLVVKAGIEIEPQILGGGQESSKRAGTENVPAIVGFGVASELAKNDIKYFTKIKDIRDFIEQEISTLYPEALVIDRKINRLPNTTSVYMPGMKAETQVINFDLEGIAISAGSACSSGKVEVSHVLQGMGIKKEIAENTIRVSLAPNTTKDEAIRFVAVWKELFFRSNQTVKKAA